CALAQRLERVSQQPPLVQRLPESEGERGARLGAAGGQQARVEVAEPAERVDDDRGARLVDPLQIVDRDQEGLAARGRAEQGEDRRFEQPRRRWGGRLETGDGGAQRLGLHGGQSVPVVIRDALDEVPQRREAERAFELGGSCPENARAAGFGDVGRRDPEGGLADDGASLENERSGGARGQEVRDELELRVAPHDLRWAGGHVPIVTPPAPGTHRGRYAAGSPKATVPA